MPAVNYDIVIEQGATFGLVITHENPDGTPINLTGMTARMQIRDSADDSLILELTTENGRITLGGTAGTITLAVTAADTAALTRGGVYDLELVNGAEVNRLVQGKATLSEEVTK